MAKTKRGLGTTVLIDKIYPIIDGVMKESSSRTRLKSCIGRFVHARHEQLYDYAPIDRIYFKQNDIDDFFRTMKMVEKEIKDVLKTTYWWGDNELAACKDPFSICMLLVLRWYLINKKLDDNKRTMTVLSYMYLAFSGKFYASCHFKHFPSFTPKREVMDYVVNYMLSKKFDLVKYGNMWSAFEKFVGTWCDTYTDQIKDGEDELLLMTIHQLYSRIYAFLTNIKDLYYKAYEEKLYINAESDNYEEDGFRIAQNNSTIATAITDKTINYMTSTTVSIARCHAASLKGVDPMDIKAIFENILNSNDKLNQLRDVINILIVDFMRNYPNIKASDVATSVEFVAHSIAMKPNSKDKDILRMKDTILEWLSTSSRYRSIRTPATKNNYFRAILTYIALTVNEASKGD